MTLEELLKRLQWGRDLAVTETSKPETTSTASLKLQWGRDLAVTETETRTPP